MKLLPIDKVIPNEHNPRYITDENFSKLVQSVKSFPKMTKIRPIVVNKEMKILGGNMRYRAMQQAGYTEVPVEVVDLTEAEQKQFIIKDNLESGQWDWDKLGNEWDKEQLENWGMILEKKEEEFDPDYSQKLGEIIYEPKETKHKIFDLYEKDTRFDEDIKKIGNEQLREMLQLRAANFCKFNFSKIADFYAYQATPDEQKIIERLALVLLDRDKLIELGFSTIIKDAQKDDET